MGQDRGVISEVRRWSLHRGRPRRWLGRQGYRFEIGFGRVKYVLQWVPNKGICAMRREGWGLRGAAILPLVLHEEYPCMKRRQPTSGLSDAQTLVPLESKLLGALSPLLEHMAIRKYEDGTARETGWVTIKTQGAAWVVQVKDPDGCCSFAAVGQTIDQALETAALLLAAEEAPWEPDRFLMDAASRKKKK